MINTSTANGRKNQYKLALLVGLVLVAIVISLVFKAFDTVLLQKFIQRYEKVGLLICLLTYGLLGFTVIPSEPVTLLILAWKGPVIAMILAIIGNTLAALAEFFIGGNIGDLTDFETKKEKLPFHLGRLPINSPIFMLLARMLPGFGPKFVSVAAGVYHVPLFTYLWTMLVSNMLGAGLVVLGGTGILKLIQ